MAVNDLWLIGGLALAALVLGHSSNSSTGPGDPSISSVVTDNGATITATYPGANSTQG
jgi:hypothetical protein